MIWSSWFVGEVYGGERALLLIAMIPTCLNGVVEALYTDSDGPFEIQGGWPLQRLKDYLP